MTKGLAGLEVLVGEWTSSSEKYPDGRGRMTVAPTEDGKYLRIEARVDDPRFPVSTQIVGADDATDEFTSLYHDSRGVHRVYRMTLADGTWKTWRYAPGFNQRYIGKLVGDGKTIAGQWEFSEDGESWRVDFDLTYRKVG
ncbi:MAG TPA: hypothetical protein VHQ03_00050 [Candidatus Dormibacteraeota bacterium]|nr:hypothetical protein [Candidatus Dormibacteraeota bacterium]